VGSEQTTGEKGGEEGEGLEDEDEDGNGELRVGRGYHEEKVMGRLKA
jgi:hypothetical protein